MGRGIGTLCGAEPGRCSPEQRRSQGTLALAGSERDRLAIRRAYRCPCDGESDRWEGPVDPDRAAKVEAEHEASEVCTALRTETCPWAGLYDDGVRLVRWCNSFGAQLAEAWGDEPEAWLVDATIFYRRALEAAVAKVNEKPREVVEVGEKGGRIRG